MRERNVGIRFCRPIMRPQDLILQSWAAALGRSPVALLSAGGSWSCQMSQASAIMLRSPSESRAHVVLDCSGIFELQKRARTADADVPSAAGQACKESAAFRGTISPSVPPSRQVAVQYPCFKSRWPRSDLDVECNMRLALLVRPQLHE
jgi:hypothetical protein